jgi:5-methylcytosine-specific restriction endonuclease McrA
MVTADLRWAIFERDGYACGVCGSRSDLTVDHVSPVIVGGRDEPDNLRTLCRRCNSFKGARG